MLSGVGFGVVLFSNDVAMAEMVNQANCTEGSEDGDDGFGGERNVEGDRGWLLPWLNGV